MLSTFWNPFRDIDHDHDHNRILSVTIFTLLITIIIAAALSWLRNRTTPPLPPGPTGLPLVGYLPFLGQNLHRDFTKLANIYGPIYKLWLGNKLCIVISSPSLLKQVVRDQDTVFANRDLVVAATVTSYGGSDIVFSPYGPVWKKLRKIFVGKMLSNNILDNLYGLRRKAVKNTVSRIYGRIGTPIDIGSLSLLTAANAVMTMLFGASMVKGEKGIDLVNLEELRQALGDIMVLLGKPNVSDLFPWLARFDIQGIVKETKKVARVFDMMINSAIKEQRKVKEKGGGGESSDFLQFLLDLHEHGDDETSITLSQLKAMLKDIVLGGIDTTITMVEWTMAELLKHPETMSKVHEELTRVVGLTNMVEESHLSELTYLNAVVKETFRLHPALPFLLPRVPSQSTTVGGYYIPKGANVYLNVWAIQRDPSIWENPLEFQPERFLNNVEKFEFSGNNFHFLPFGTGRRICAGIPLGERVLIYILASFLHSFDWKLPPNVEVELSDRFGIVVKKQESLVAIPTPRLSNLELYL